MTTIRDKRLALESQSLRNDPLPFVATEPALQPSSNGVATWHANIFTPADDEVSLHLIIHFPVTYPLTAPQLFVATPYCHQNVDQVAHANGMYPVCLDMLSSSETTTKWSGWSPAFTVRGLLVQLQSTLMDTNLLTVTHRFTVDQCQQHSQQFTCAVNENRHTYAAPWPPLRNTPLGGVDAQDDSDSNDSFEMPTIVKVTVFDDKRQEKKKMKFVATATAATAATATTATTTFETKEQDKPKTHDYGWTVVGVVTQALSQAKHTQAKHTQAKHTATQQLAQSKTTKSKNHFTPLKSNFFCNGRSKKKVTKASLKNKRRRENKRLQKENVKQETHRLKQEKTRPTTTIATLETKKFEPRTTDILVATKPKKTWLERLPRHLLVLLLGFTLPKEVQALSCCSSCLRAMSKDGWIWRQLFQRSTHAGGSIQSCSDWRRMYEVEKSGSLSVLKCFYTQHNFQDDVLGVPLDFTRNPRTGKSDYISVYCDSLLSKTAWHVHGIRTTAWNEKAACLLPLYISEAHFQQALPAIKKTIAEIAGQASYSLKSMDTFVPSMVLDVLPSAMKTLALLLATRAESVSDAFADTLVQIHRLLVRLIEEYPKLRVDIRSRLQRFIRGGPHQRSKEVVPSLGDLIPLLAVCPEYSYEDLLVPYFKENLDRGIIWTFKDFPNLAKRSRSPVGGVDQELLDKSFVGRTVSNRLFLVNRAILNCLLRPSASKTIQDTCFKHDFLLGQASPESKKNFVRSITQALEIKSWKEFLVLSGLRMNDGTLPSPLVLSNWLRKASENSLDRGYHQRGMNFAKLHKSGGSRLLRKGENQSLGRASKIKLNDSWRWKNAQMFLDASVLCFDFNGKHMAYLNLDFSNTQRRGMSHSGDVIDHDNCKGKHTVDIDLNRIDRKIQSLVIVLSAYSEATMEAAVQPNVAIVDVASGSELCRYELEAKSVALNGMKNVIMCRIWRSEHGAAWRVDAVGAIGEFGDAACYDPIVNNLEATFGSCVESKEEEEEKRESTATPGSWKHSMWKK